MKGELEWKLGKQGAYVGFWGCFTREARRMESGNKYNETQDRDKPKLRDDDDDGDEGHACDEQTTVA